MPASPHRPPAPAFPQQKTRHASALAARLSLAVLLGCGGPPSAPPDLTPDFEKGSFPEGDIELGRLALRDRSLLRSGYACADCHPVPDGERLRGAPDLTGLVLRPGPFWQEASPQAAGAIARCAARYGATAATPAFPMGHLLAALGQQQSSPPAPAAAPSAAAPSAAAPSAAAPSAAAPSATSDWQRACAHCHDAGPAPQLHGRPWPAARMVAAVRHTDLPRHPSSLMPPLASSLLDDARLAAIALALEAGTLQSAPATPKVGKTTAQ
jgi:cytochrome c2